MSQRRIQRQREIHTAACRLVLEHGFDGFTMDDLAEAVGVSRRTLFNHMKDKASAVLGLEDDLVHDAIEAFMAGGPSGHLVADVFHLVNQLSEDLEADDPDLAERHRLREAAIRADSKVLRLTEQFFVEIFDEMVAAICTRERWPADDLRARTLCTTMLGLVKVSFDEILAGRADSFHHAFDNVSRAHFQLVALH